MTNEQREALRKDCVDFLRNSGFSVFNSKRAKELAYAFWCGVLRHQEATGEGANAYVTMMLLSGRIDELLKEPT